jgi:hypothetical protein
VLRLHLQGNLPHTGCEILNLGGISRVTGRGDMPKVQYRLVESEWEIEPLSWREIEPEKSATVRFAALWVPISN